MMPNVTVHNQLEREIQVYNSTSDGVSSGKASQNTSYYGTLTRMCSVAAGGQSAVTLTNDFVDVLIAFDTDNAPIARYAWSILDSDSPPDFTVSADDLQVMKDCEKFVMAVGAAPKGALAKSFQKVVHEGPDAVNKYFESSPVYKDCTFQSYMLAVTYEAENRVSQTTAPDAPKEYSLALLIEAVSGLPYPSDLPDISVSKFYCEYVNGVLKFGCTVDLDQLPFPSETARNSVVSWLSSATVDVELTFNTELGLNIAGTQIIFLANDFHIPVGSGHSITLKQPRVVIDITPAFKFVVFTAATTLPFTIFGKSFDAELSMTIDNVEAAVGAVISGDNLSLPSPAILQGIHFDQFGVNMGVMFEPPGYALGIEGKFHIGSGSNRVALDDDTFCIVCELEDDVPNPVYLSFYVPKQDASELINLFTNSHVNLGLPVVFEDLSFVWCEDPMKPVELPDGSLSKGELAFSGYMAIIGLKFFCNLQVSLNGIEGNAQLSPMDIGRILRITGNSKPLTGKFDAQGDLIKNNFVAVTAAQKDALKNATRKTIVPGGGAEMTVNTSKSPYFTMDASMSLLGVTDTVEAQLDSNGAHCRLSYGSILHTDLAITLKDRDNFSGEFSYGPNFHVHLSKLGVSMGTIHIDMTIHALLAVAVQNEHVDFTVGGGFEFEGQTHDFGPFHLDVNLTGIDQVLSAIEQGIINDADSIFAALLSDAKKWAQWVKNEIIKDVQHLMSGLKQGFRLFYTDAASVMHDVGCEAKEISQGLSDAYEIGADAVADVLKSFGYSGDVISDALHYAGYGLDEVVKGLKDIGEDAEDVAQSVSGVFDETPGALSAAMQAAGYAVDDIKDAFESLGGDFASFAENTWEDVEHDVDPSNW